MLKSIADLFFKGVYFKIIKLWGDKIEFRFF